MKKYIVAVICVALIFLIFITFDLMKVKLNISEVYSKDEEKTIIHFIDSEYFPQKIFDNFSIKYPNIKVEFEQYGINQYTNLQRTRILSSKNIDVMGIMNRDYSKFIDENYLDEITNEEFLKNYNKESILELESISNSKKVFAVPYKSKVYGIWYNKILFDKYNLKFPKNYEEFIVVCKTLQSKGINPMVLGCRDNAVSSYVYYISTWGVLNRDPNFFRKLKTGAVKWTDKEMLDAFENTDEFIKNGYLSKKSISLTYEQAFSSFVNGQSAMCLMDDSSINMYKPDTEKICDLGVFPIPYNKVGNSIKVPGLKASSLIGIFSESKHKKEARLLVSYLSDVKTAQLYCDETLSNCNINDISTSKLKHDDLWQPLRNRALIPPITSVLDLDVEEELNSGANELIIGSKKVGEILKEIQVTQDEVNSKRIK